MKIQTNRDIYSDSDQIIRLSNKYKFVYAVDDYDDENKPTKKFYGIDNLDELNKKIHNKKKDDRNFYQVVLSKKCKMYFDLDHLDYNRAEIDDIIDNFINEINKLFDVNININDLIIQSNNDKNNISSLHIIVKSFYTDYYQMKKFIYYMKVKHEIEIDDIYTKSRQFRLCNNKKIGKDDSKFLINYNNNDFDIYDEWIDIIDKLEYKKIKDEFIIKDSKQDQKIIIDKLDDYLYCHMKEHINDKFYFTKSWTSLLLILDKYFEFVNMSKEDYINDFLKFSAQKSNNKYTYDKNKLWYNKIKTQKNNYTLYKLKNILNYNTNNNYTLKDNTTNNYIDKLFNLTKINKDIIISKLQEDIKEINFDNNIIYDKSKKILYMNNKIYNLNEDYYKYKLSNNNLTYDKTNIKPHEIGKYINEFTEQKHDIFIIRGKWSCGKTHYIMKPIINKCKDNSILIITENNTLNSEYYDELKQYGFITHQKKTNIKDTDQKIIISLESLHKLGGRDFDLVIFDEFESIISHLESKTIFENYNYSVNSAIEEINHYIKSSKQLLFLDADISIDRVNNIIYENRPKNNNKYFTFTIDNDNYKDCIYYLYLNSHQKIRNNIINDTLNKSPFVLSTTTRIRGERYYNLLFDIIQSQNININICLITSNGVKLNKKEYEYNKKKTAQDNITKFLNDNNIDIFIFTPTFKTGANIRRAYKKHYSIGCNNSVNVRIYNQMIHRTRTSKDNNIEFHIYIEKANTNLYYNLDLDQTKKYIQNINIINNNNDIQKYKINLLPEDKEKFITNNNYLTIRAINYKENYNHKRNFLPYLIYTLKYTHNSNIQYIDGREDKTNLDIFTKLIKEANELENNLLVQTPIINKDELEEIKKTSGDDKSNIQEYEEIERLQIKKYYILDKYKIPVIEKIKNSKYDIKRKYLFSSNLLSNNTSIRSSIKKYINDFETKNKIIDEYNNTIINKLQIKIIDNNYYETYNSSTKIYNDINKKFDINKYIDVRQFIINDIIIYDDFYNNDDYIKDDDGFINIHNLDYIHCARIKDIIRELGDIQLYKKYLINVNKLYNEYKNINQVEFYNQIKKNEYNIKYNNIKYLHNNKYENENNEIHTDKAEIKLKNKIILNLCKLLKIDIYNNKINNKNYITNVDLFEIYKKVLPELQEIEENINTNYNCLFEINDNTFKNITLDVFRVNKGLIETDIKKNISNITKKINKILNRINKVIKYSSKNKNVSRAFDRIIISNSTYDIETTNINISKELLDLFEYKIPKINYNDNYDCKDLLLDITKIKSYRNKLLTEDGRPIYKYKTSNYKLSPNEKNNNVKLEDNIIYRTYKYNKKMENKLRKYNKNKSNINKTLGEFVHKENNIIHFQKKKLYYPNVHNNKLESRPIINKEDIKRYTIPNKKYNIDFNKYNLEPMTNINNDCKICIHNIIKTIEAY